jgi:hypothetical protein
MREPQYASVTLPPDAFGAFATALLNQGYATASAAPAATRCPKCGTPEGTFGPQHAKYGPPRECANCGYWGDIPSAARPSNTQLAAELRADLHRLTRNTDQAAHVVNTARQRLCEIMTALQGTAQLAATEAAAIGSSADSTTVQRAAAAVDYLSIRSAQLAEAARIAADSAMIALFPFIQDPTYTPNDDQDADEWDDTPF